MKCPICESTIEFNAQEAVCEGGHSFSMLNGVYRIVSPEFGSILHPFVESLEDFRKEAYDHIDPKTLPQLPNVNYDKGLWDLRKIDLKLVENHIEASYETALDIGSWNGWLTHHLARKGLETVAVDYFTHHLDGLGAKQHYAEDWLAIQMNLERIELLDRTFDLIVVNRCLNYFTEPELIVERLKKLLNRGGTILILGLTYVRDIQSIKVGLKEVGKAFEAKYKVPFMFKEFRGYLLKSDLETLKKSGVHIRLHKELRLQSWSGRLIAKQPIYYFGIFKMNENIKKIK